MLCFSNIFLVIEKHINTGEISRTPDIVRDDETRDENMLGENEKDNTGICYYNDRNSLIALKIEIRPFTLILVH